MGSSLGGVGVHQVVEPVPSERQLALFFLCVVEERAEGGVREACDLVCVRRNAHGWVIGDYGQPLIPPKG